MKPWPRWVWIGLLVALGLALLSPLASPYPDGLERVAEDHGFIERAQEAPYRLLPDYTFPGLGEGPLSTILAGLTGTLLLFAVGSGMARFLRRPVEGAGGRADG